MLRAAAYAPPPETPDRDHPFWLATGRTIHHFHTRTNTGRVPQLDAAAPDVWVEVSSADAGRLGLAEGDLAEVGSPRGTVHARVRVSGTRPGVLFLPFHYGYWDVPGGAEGSGAHRAANETTITDWDPASKQPLFKTGIAGIRLTRRGDGRPAPAPSTAASAPVTGPAPPAADGR
ncbi:hypothetical protein SBRY_40293 [Actinacidiphila bryophytorum]|uniref:Molybdopterin dinucleotide-binding domain-containing protein n=1 Tax=Actinacidiphila bryophytorum TaxID=1436133 RepID=A0A9W4MCT8_9ACTN|nr:hypothetical protein SBRY_40293 [Actinacidiphila bryophytorum]